jgi:hypothetical protein
VQTKGDDTGDPGKQGAWLVGFPAFQPVRVYRWCVVSKGDINGVAWYRKLIGSAVTGQDTKHKMMVRL